MAIDPLKSQGTPSPDVSRLRARATEESRQPVAAERDTKAPAPAGPDRVEVSTASRQIAEVRGAEASQGSSLSPERMKQVLERVESGFYDRADVQGTVAAKVAKDLGTE